MYSSDYNGHSYTIEECRKLLKRDVSEFGSRYELLSKALELLECDEHRELIRDWFDLYMSIIDERSYLEVSDKLEELETNIIEAWREHQA